MVHPVFNAISSEHFLFADHESSSFQLQLLEFQEIERSNQAKVVSIYCIFMM